MHARILVRLSFTFVVLLFLNSSVDSQSRTSDSPSNEGRVRAVFLNVTGDPKHAQRLWTIVGFELEDIGVQLTNNESKADAVISARVTATAAESSIYVGLLHAELLVNGTTVPIDSCETKSTSAESELFASSAKKLVRTIRTKYPDLRTLSIDRASDMALSPAFAEDLSRELRSAGVGTQSSDSRLRVNLLRVAVPVASDEIRYEAKIGGPPGLAVTQTGSVTIASRLAGTLPQVCSYPRSEELDWMTTPGSLYGVAQQLAATIRRHNADFGSKSDSAKRLDLVAPSARP